MKKLSITVFLLVLIGSVAGGAARSYAANDSLNAFWEKFKAAVIKGDKETVAALSAFPIGMGYGIKSIRNKAQVMKNYRDIFTHATTAANCSPPPNPTFT